MSPSLILLLVGSGCLLFRESCLVDSRTIYGTYNVWDHLGHPYSEPHPTSTTDHYQVNGQGVTHNDSSSLHHLKSSKQLTYNYHDYLFRHHPRPSSTHNPPVSTSSPPTTEPQPPSLQSPFVDSIARPFPDETTSVVSVSAATATTSPPQNDVTHKEVQERQQQQQFQQPQVQQEVQQQPPHQQVQDTSVSAVSGVSPHLPAITRMPLYMYNPQLARKLGFSTFMMGSILYGLSLIPALLAAGVSGSGPFAGFLSSLTGESDSDSRRRRRKRSSPPSLTNAYRFREMPLLDNSSSYRFLSLVENTMEVRKVEREVCKKYYMCRVYQTVVETTMGMGIDRPSLHDFEIAVIDTFGVAAERTGHRVDLLTTVKNYLDSALVGAMGGNCSRIFPCPGHDDDRGGTIGPTYHHQGDHRQSGGGGGGYYPPYGLKGGYRVR